LSYRFEVTCSWTIIEYWDNSIFIELSRVEQNLTWLDSFSALLMRTCFRTTKGLIIFSESTIKGMFWIFFCCYVLLKIKQLHKMKYWENWNAKLFFGNGNAKLLIGSIKFIVKFYLWRLVPRQMRSHCRCAIMNIERLLTTFRWKKIDEWTEFTSKWKGWWDRAYMRL
jgi:hypothetical protein